MFDFCMPALGADMEAGTLVAWHVEPGARVRRGQVVVDVETAKGVIEVEIWQEGIVRELVVPVGVKVPVGTVLARLDEASATTSASVSASAVSPSPAASSPAAPPPPVAVAPPAAPAAPPSAAARSSDRPLASPAARRRAMELGVDLQAVRGTKAHGVISIDDVERAAGAAPTARITPPPFPPASAPVPSTDPSAMRRAIAAAMGRSKREIPHYYLAADVDMRRALDWLRDRNAERPVADRVLPAVLLLKSVASALRDAPALNGFYIDGTFRPGAGVHLGVAIALRGGGLVAPAIHDVDRLSLDELMRALADLTARARSGTLRGSELTDATITVTSLGDRGAESVFGVIYPPQVAIVGFGKITERPWAEAGMLGVHPIVTATLAADHRASDGHLGGRFLAAVGERLQHPEGL